MGLKLLTNECTQTFCVCLDLGLRAYPLVIQAKYNIYPFIYVRKIYLFEMHVKHIHCIP
jgi:hypothetical protein